LDNQKELDNQKGDTITSGSISGHGNIIGKNISATITIGNLTNELSKIDNEYAKSLTDFANSIQEQVKKEKISEKAVEPILADIQQVGEEVKDIKNGQDEKEIDVDKQLIIESKLSRVIRNVLTVLPEWAETIAGFTPLAPFSKLIGKTVDKVVERIVEKKKNS
jgi:hypothetical protein